MMKKISTAVILCAMLLSIFAAPAGAAAVTDVVGTNYEEPVELLTRIGIADVDEGYYYPAKVITKMEFIVLAMRMIGYTDQLVMDEPEQLFFDVTPETAGAGYISEAYRLGIVSGNGDGFLGADQNVTKDEAIAIMIRALQYTLVAEERGGYPAGYVLTANRLGLMDHVTFDSTGYLNRGMAAQMAYNALETEPVTKLQTGNSHQYETTPGQTLLEAVFGIYHVEGVLDGDKFVNLPDGIGVKEGHVTIERVLYEIEDEYEGKFLGERVSAYYTSRDGVKKIMYLIPKNNTVTQIKAKDVISCKPGELLYEKDQTGGGKSSRVALSPYTVTVWNNMVRKVDEDGLEIPDYGLFELIDNDRDGQVDIIHVTAFDIMLLGAVDSSQQILYNKNNTAKAINIKDYDKLYLYGTDGQPIGIDALSEDDVLEVCASENKMSIEIFQVQNYLNITVQGLKTEEEDLYVVDENGASHRVSGAYYENNKREEILLGKSYQFAMNRDNEIVCIVEGSGGVMSYGYIAKSSYIKSRLEDELYLKLFTLDEEFIEVQAASKVKIYNSDAKPLTPDKLADRVAKPQLIRYKLDAEGKIKTIDFASEYAFGDGFRQVGNVPTGSNGTVNRYKGATKTIGGKILVGANTKAIVIPSEDRLDEDSEYTVASGAYFDDDEYYPGATGYTTDPNSPLSEVVVIPGRTTTIGSGSPIMLVTEFGQGVDEDGIPVRRLIGLVSGKETGYNVTDGLPLSYTLDKTTKEEIPVEEGDVIQFNTDNKGMIAGLKIIYDQSREQVYGKNDSFDTSVAFADQSRQNLGVPEFRRGNCLFITPENGTGIPAGVSDDIYVLTNSYVYEYDSTQSRSNRARAITINDIITREDNPSDTSKVFLSLRYSDPKVVVVYK